MISPYLPVLITHFLAFIEALFAAYFDMFLALAAFWVAGSVSLRVGSGSLEAVDFRTDSFEVAFIHEWQVLQKTSLQNWQAKERVACCCPFLPSILREHWAHNYPSLGMAFVWLQACSCSRRSRALNFFTQIFFLQRLWIWIVGFFFEDISLSFSSPRDLLIEILGRVGWSTIGI